MDRLEIRKLILEFVPTRHFILFWTSNTWVKLTTTLSFTFLRMNIAPSIGCVFTVGSQRHVQFYEVLCISCIFCQESFNVFRSYPQRSEISWDHWGLFGILEFGLGTEMRLVFGLECLVTTPRFHWMMGISSQLCWFTRRIWSFETILINSRQLKQTSLQKITLNQSLKQTIWLNRYMSIIFIPFTKPH